MLTLEELENLREERGSEIAHKKESQVSRVEESFYTVKSQSGNGEYPVCQVDHEWVCECPDYKYRNVKCKHIFAVEFSIALRQAVDKVRIEPIVSLQVCQICASKNVIKDGLRHNKNGDIQVLSLPRLWKTLHD